MGAIIWLEAVLVLSVLLFALNFSGPKIVCGDKNNLINPQYLDKTLFLSAIKQNSKVAVATNTISGIIVPHHLLAKDLMASTFARLKNQKYQEIILLSPNHFEVGPTAISVTTKDFNTVFGVIKTDSLISKHLKSLPFVSEADFFYREHGLQAQLPFIKYYFPQAQLVAVTFKSSTTKEELALLIKQLKIDLKPNTLIIQSTDFSHYLTKVEAQSRDRETLETIKFLPPDKVFSLNQPKNIDSLAAQFVQSELQKDYFHSQIEILVNKNSQDYTSNEVTSTTSYITALYRQ